MNRLLFLFFLYLSLSPVVIGQDTLKTIHSRSDYIYLDPLNHIYSQYQNRIIKFSPGGDSLYSYSNNTLGNIGSLHTQNPLRIFVYYPYHNSFMYLDKTLSPLGSPVWLDEQGFSSVLSICPSASGGIWIINGFTRKLHRLSADWESVSISPILPDELFTGSQSIKMIEKHNEVFIHSGETIFRLNEFGQPLPRINSIPDMFSITNEKIIYMSDNQLMAFDLSSLLEYPLYSLQSEHITDFAINDNMLIICKKDEFSILSVNLSDN